ncbi:MAG: tryptophan synthase subunit alpha [Candidatus Kapabacteria bacterium]|jgi:tryptophan synthase alpha chain|nr:tryptophan synthase subunit alpha [Candidatus Kapabacteria bacterium]
MTANTTQNRINTLFSERTTPVLSVYFTAGFPNLHDTSTILSALQANDVDMIEIGMPFSDPVADGEIIQESSSQALKNGMTTELLFAQLRDVRTRAENPITMPLVLMGYVNPVIQYGVERFCADCAEVGIDGVILPDLPPEVFEEEWKPLFERYKLHHILLITPQTPEERIRRIDEISSGFLYAVSSSGTTGGALAMDDARTAYFQRLKRLKESSKIQNPVIIGFGIRDKASFDAASEYAAGAIIGSAFIKELGEASNEALPETIRRFVAKVR